MPFTVDQKAQFIALLQSRGWQLDDGIIWSPRRGIYFNDAHFNHWSPVFVQGLFSHRAIRLEKHEKANAKTSLKGAAAENLQASWAAKEVLKSSS